MIITLIIIAWLVIGFYSVAWATRIVNDAPPIGIGIILTIFGCIMLLFTILLYLRQFQPTIKNPWKRFEKKY